MMMDKIKYFSHDEVKAALKHSSSGGVALHVFKPSKKSNAPAVFKMCARKGQNWAHLLDQNKTRLIMTARMLGVKKVAVHREGLTTQHIDLCGWPLFKAIQEAEEASAMIESIDE